MVQFYSATPERLPPPRRSIITPPFTRVNQRNGYRSRAWDTRVGTMELHIPKLREGSYFPSLLEPRRRSERALLAVIQQAYVEGEAGG